MTEDGEKRIGDALFAIADAIRDLSYSVSSGADALGLNNAATSRGALEVVAQEIRDGLHVVAREIAAIPAGEE